MFVSLQSLSVSLSALSRLFTSGRFGSICPYRAKRHIAGTVSAKKRVFGGRVLQLHLGESVVDDLTVEVGLCPVLLLGLPRVVGGAEGVEPVKGLACGIEHPEVAGLAVHNRDRLHANRDETVPFRGRVEVRFPDDGDEGRRLDPRDLLHRLGPVGARHNEEGARRVGHPPAVEDVLVALPLLLRERPDDEDPVAPDPGREDDVGRALLVLAVLELVAGLAELGGKDPPCRFALERALGLHAGSPPARFRSAASSAGSKTIGVQELTSSLPSNSLPLQV